jgi:hypothetical protein
LSSSEKLESDYKSLIEKVEQTVAADKEKIRTDLNALKDKAARFAESS